MKRLQVLALSVLALTARCGLPGSAPSDGSAPAVIDAPTVVVISIDTLRADRLGCYGHAGAGTPVIDALASNGARFESAETTAPLTLPAHSSLLTGRSLPAHGVFNNGTFKLPSTVPTLAESFQRAGYATGAFVSSPVLSARYGLGRGFDRYDDQIAKKTPQQGLVVHYDERSGRETATHAIAWVDGLGNKPAMLFVHLWEPHAPYQPPAELAQQFANDRYQGEVAAADAALGRLLEGLRALGRGGKLLVVVTADHGEGLGAHGEPTHGLFLYRETMRVPLVFNGPQLGIKAAVHRAPVSLADIAPTLLELSALPALAEIDGRSLAAMVRGQGEAPNRDGVFAESHLPQLDFGWSGLRALVSTDGTRLIDSPTPELFDETVDPDAAHDLAAARVADVTLKRRALNALVDAAAALKPASEAEHSVSAEELERLRSLGYAATGRQAATGHDLVDPKRVNPRDRVTFVADFDQASARTRENRHAEAIALYRKLLAIEPKNPGLLLQFGQALMLAGQLPEAQVQIRAAIAVDPSYGLAWYRLGQLLDNAKRVPEAEAAYRKAIQTDPANVEPRKALAGLLTENKRIPEAIQELEQAKAIDPNDASLARDIERLWARTRR